MVLSFWMRRLNFIDIVHRVEKRKIYILQQSLAFYHMATSESKKEMSEWRVHDPYQLLNEDFLKAFVILNQPISNGVASFLKLNWSKAVLKVAVDGGLNRLVEIQDPEHPLIPDLICGDFDSVSEDVLSHHSRMQSEIVATPDQNETDFTKALRQCIEKLNEKSLQVSAILAFARSAGRIDHILGNLNTLYLYSGENLSDVPLYLVGENSLTWVLAKGKHKIIFNEQMTDRHVGLIPLGHPCPTVTTSGLEWNLDGHRLEFGHLVSTSNKFGGIDVTVQNDSSLLWTMEFDFF